MSGPINVPVKKSYEMVKYEVPVRRTNKTILDGAFTFMKERFSEEMRRMDEEMTKFSKNIASLYGQPTTVQMGLTTDNESPANWEAIHTSPLIMDKGDHKILNLQFDVTQYDPEEVVVTVIDNLLSVSATHEEHTDNSRIFNQFNKELFLPNGVRPDSVEAALSKDGVLTVTAPVNLKIEDNSSKEKTLKIRD